MMNFFHGYDTVIVAKLESLQPANIVFCQLSYSTSLRNFSLSTPSEDQAGYQVCFSNSKKVISLNFQIFKRKNN